MRARSASSAHVPVTRDRTAEFYHRREDATRKRARDRLLTHRRTVSSPASQTTSPSASPTSRLGFGWLLRPLGLAQSPVSPSAQPLQSPSAEANKPSPLTSGSSLATCPGCGRTLGAGAIVAGTVRCHVCGKDHCSRCAQSVLGLLGPSDVFPACPKCRAVLSGEEAKAEFGKRVATARANNRLYGVVTAIGELRTRLETEMTKLDYLTGSLSPADLSAATSSSPRSTPNRASAPTSAMLDVVLEQQRLVSGILQRLDESMKQLTSASWTPTESRLALAVKRNLTDVLSTSLIQYKRLTEKQGLQELDVATSIYVTVMRCRMEAKDNKAFEGMFGQKFNTSLQAMSKELFRTCVDHGVDWKVHKAKIDDSVVTWDSTRKSLISDEASSVTGKTTSANMAGTEGRMMRRAVAVLSQCMRNADTQVSVEKLVETKRALAILIDEIQMRLDKQLQDI